MDAIESADAGRRQGAATGQIWLRRAATLWFAIAAAGQAAFVWMILAHYGAKTLAANYGGWNDKPLIKGHVPGDTAGNIMFAAHVLLAALVTTGGLMQLVPAIRRNAPWLHRWTGRMFFSVAIFMALGGLWLTWVRQTYLSIISAAAVSLDGVLILICAIIAWRFARKRNFAAHRRWAIRAFMVVNGVWFLRVGLMAWVLVSGGGMGMNRSLSGPADIVIQFGAYLIPLAMLELYFRAQDSRSLLAKRMVAALLMLSAAVTLLGIGGAIAFMWWDYM
ncbi:MAG: DUF2306 domain-containing protein [Oxalobacteraceae bacterium]|nr:MAG: DUF2306 domain-containing protein [Oxalobacteraceae bacterium]